MAAVEIFAQKGFSAATTGEIAKKAGVAEGLIFKYFKSKKELLLSLVLPILKDFIAPISLKRLQAIFTREFSTLEEFLTAIFEERVTFIVKNRHLIRVIFQEASTTFEIQAVLKRVFKEKLAPKLKECLKNFQEKGMIIDMPIDSLFRLIATNIAGYVLFTEILYRPEAEGEGYSDQEVELKRTIEFIARGLRPNTKAKPALKPRAKKKPSVPTTTKVKKKRNLSIGADSYQEFV
ncbi:Transcriptional regulator, AcrR-family [Leptospira borgpetersenii serovar Hardjo-bovis str. L550]|uniref:Transcriptional regulator, AcrR-family n=1 Tax=Leptospira borgpetersenii serovar Hardjo-bovis (strain JB197) TaxID=355277 RepID=Q04TW1_LEPBJ|nr:Transcriptional regulator, AcrR-family [Leptospira borgpetersenii serovar Hardjo-bovis str. JB197]ABJ79431.1 Transcriptional regulator, AcrR-family [Leptospira borgpetersenii serovar Hardjo-bovis str. L550]AMX58755.1 AcrR family transcriptional regulator [Leptospira borgpetersenii serovar Hardjo]AWV71687.1 TetR/AcrR family transcriptional regulator [Leptospira borgpetersenii serovar Hardjo-bovis]TQE54331.1 helix-turn-helix transcriptional regulator [Leptospira borgpetersenii]